MDLMYCPRFLSQSVEGPSFPDLAWTLPDIIYGPQDLPRTLFTCSMIEKVTTLRRWLVTELKYRSSNTTDDEIDRTVLPFHSLIDDGDRRAVLTALECGSVRYIVATICANVGIDMTVTNVVCVDIPDSFEEMIQWAGRASRDGSGGMLVVYASKDLKRIKSEERKLDAYVPSNERRRALTAKQIERRDKVQGKMPRGIVDFFNPGDGECPRVTVCRYFGDTLNRPLPPLRCCDKCNPETLDAHIQKVNTYQPTPLYCQPKPKRRVMNAPGRSFPEMTRELKEKVYTALVNWQHRIWRSRPFSMDESDYLSPEIIIMNSDLSSLATNIHKATTRERFDMLVQWDSVAPLTEGELDCLWEEVQMWNDQFGKEMEALTRAKRPKSSKARKENNLADLISEPPMIMTTESMATEDRELVLEVEGPRKRNRSERGMYEDEQKKLAVTRKESRKKI